MSRFGTSKRKICEQRQVEVVKKWLSFWGEKKRDGESKMMFQNDQRVPMGDRMGEAE